MHVLMAVAEFEREIIRERTKAGLVAAVARGSKLGRKARKWTPEEVATIEAHDGTIAGLARKLACSLGTAHKLLKNSVPVDSEPPTA
jgi:DNA invertase Pin-like site-specific DNA recombinase